MPLNWKLKLYTTLFLPIFIIIMLSSIAAHVESFHGRLPLLQVPGGSKLLLKDYKTILDPPNHILLDNGREYAMIILINKQQVLLQIPNELGWKYHFGCYDDDPQKEQKLKQALQLKENDYIGKLSPCGIMFFSFPNDRHMRVKVYKVDASSIEVSSKLVVVGKYYTFDQVPYDRMWADDRIWMPSLLLNNNNNNNHYFEGHFIFNGPPGTDTPIIDYNYQTYSR